MTTMLLPQFQAGDKVYCPSLGTSIYVLEQTKTYDTSVIIDFIAYPLKITHTEQSTSTLLFNEQGHALSEKNKGVPNVSLFLATHDNWVKLQEIHGKAFEKPTGFYLAGNFLQACQSYNPFALALAKSKTS